MTGYAVATSEGAAGTLTIEIKSVNSRFLDLQFRINDELRALEPDLRAAIMAAITRGKVEARLSFGRKVAGGAQALNQALLADLARLQSEVTRHFVSAPLMSVAELLRWPGVVEEAQIGQQFLVQRRGAAGDLAPEREARFNLAARDGGHDGGAQVRFQRAQFVVDAELKIEKARIDAFDFNRKGARSAFAGSHRIACHA